MYNILCDSLGVDPLPSNGTLRLPLKPVGLHSDENVPVLDTPSDPPQTTTSADPPVQTAQPSPEPTKPANTSAPAGDESDESGENGSWWDTVWNKFDDFKDWAGGVADAIKGNHPHSDSE